MMVGSAFFLKFAAEYKQRLTRKGIPTLENDVGIPRVLVVLLSEQLKINKNK